jgi:hypothetical protein
VEVEIAVLDKRGGDHLRELGRWLAGEDELRGRVRLVDREPGSAKLGAWSDALLAVLAPGGAAAACAAGLISWLRARTTDVVLRVRRPDGAEVEVSASRVRRVRVDELQPLVETVAGWLQGERTDPGIPGG